MSVRYMESTSHNRRVAVVIPVYGGRYLTQALESVFVQSRSPDEVIVVDDGSPDSAAVRRAVLPFADRVRLIRQSNQGAGAARNVGITATSADFIALLDSDDVWLPGFLAEQLNAFAVDPALDLVYSDGLYVGHTPLAGARFMCVCPSSGEVTLTALLAQTCTVLLSSVVARRAALVSAGGFDTTLRRGQDFDLWLRMACRGARMRYQRKVLTLYRRHDQALSGTAIDTIERPLRVLRRTLERMPLTSADQEVAERRVRALEAELARERGKDLLRRGDFRAAREALANANREIKNWKVQGARLGLLIAPQLVRKLYLSRLASTPP
jgi:glycosyltransferase involved in cell wall biosynthesis